MALITFIDNRRLIMTPEKAHGIWEVLNGEIEGTKQQQNYCANVAAVYLNWRNAPDSWIERNLNHVKQEAMKDWYVNRQGNPTRPAYRDDWLFAKKWGFLPKK